MKKGSIIPALAKETNLTRWLDALECSVDTLKRQFITQYSVITEEDFQALLKYREEKDAECLADHKTVKRELGLLS